MKTADALKARMGGNMLESRGAARNAPASPPAAAPFHGETPAKHQGAMRVKDALSIEVDRLFPDPDQPRKEFDPDSLAYLAASLKARGQLQTIRVRWDAAVSRWIIVAGERRRRAAKLAGLASLTCIEARGSLTPDDLMEDQLVENCIREDLKPIEQAKAFRALLDRRGWSYRRLAEALHIAPASIARALALLDLPEDLRVQVEAGELAASTAYEVSRIEDPEAQRAVAARVVAEGMNRAEAVEAVRAKTTRAGGSGKGRGAKAKPKRTSATIRAENGAKVTVEHRRGVDDQTIRTALLDVLARLDGRAEIGDAA